jgi:hypothetical protein
MLPKPRKIQKSESAQCVSASIPDSGVLPFAWIQFVRGHDGGGGFSIARPGDAAANGRGTGQVVMLLSGPLLFSSDPEMYDLSRPFQVKMVCLLLALVFHYTVHRRATSPSNKVTGGKAIACVSLALWTSVIAGGIFMGFA